MPIRPNHQTRRTRKRTDAHRHADGSCAAARHDSRIASILPDPSAFSAGDNFEVVLASAIDLGINDNTKPSVTKVETSSGEHYSSYMPALNANHSGTNSPKGPKSPFFRQGFLKPEAQVQLSNGNTVDLGGLRDDADERHVWTREGLRSAVMPFSDWHGAGADASQTLRRQGVTIVGSDMGEVRDAVAQLKKFPRLPVVTRPGWSRHGFALADGELIIPKGRPEPLKTFSADPDLLARGGTLEGWKAGVAEPLAAHALASFFLMVPFAAPLLHLTGRMDNFGFEIAGPAGLGKSTLQMFMASAAGRAIGGEDAVYWRTCNTTLGALELVMAQYNDMTLILDESGLVQDGGKVRGRALEMRNMAFKLSAGRVKDRIGQPSGPRQRLIYVLSTNRPLALLMGAAHAAETDAALDRLMTVPLLPSRTHGILDHVPAGYESAAAFINATKAAAAEHYGQAVPAFLRWLVEEEARAPKRLRRRVAAKMAAIIKSWGVGGNSGSEERVANAFALIAVAGSAARKAGVLPTTFHPKRAAKTCYDLHRNHGRIARSFEERLRELMRRPDVIDVAVCDVRAFSPERLAACPVFLYTGRSGCRELLVPTEHRKRVLSDWNQICHEPEVTHRLTLAADDRKVGKRPVGPDGKKVSVYCFDVTDLEG